VSELKDEEEVAAIVELKLECKSDPEAVGAMNPAIVSITSAQVSIDVPFDSEDGS
jgi:hypothetical protein